MFIKANSDESDDTKKYNQSFVWRRKRRRERWFTFSFWLLRLSNSREFSGILKCTISKERRRIQFIWWNLMMLILSRSVTRSIIYDKMGLNSALSRWTRNLLETEVEFVVILSGFSNPRAIAIPALNFSECLSTSEFLACLRTRKIS